MNKIKYLWLFIFLQSFSQIDNKTVDLVFDATGGRLHGVKNEVSKPLDLKVNIKNQNLDFTFCGITQVHNKLRLGGGALELALKRSGALYWPYLDNKPIFNYMVKLTRLCQSAERQALDYAKHNNFHNFIYVWSGKLQNEMNEGLVLVNLTNSEYQHLASDIHQPCALKAFLKTKLEIKEYLSAHLLSFLELLISKDTNSDIMIEKPFFYKPYINLNPAAMTLNSQPIFPVGDTLF